MGVTTSWPVVLKLGGELLQDPSRLTEIAAAIVRCSSGVPLLVVHGGGREVDVALRQTGIEPRKVDGVRITDGPTLAVVVSVLGGLVNARLVAAIVSAGAPAVGLTGADAACVPVSPARPVQARSGESVDLGLVGTPTGDRSPALIEELLAGGYVPVLASIGLGSDGVLYNVNADAFAADLAIRLHASRLVIAGSTPGVCDRHGRTIADLDIERLTALIATGEANAGMVAKLRSVLDAVRGGVREIILADGSDAHALSELVAHGSSEQRARYTRIGAMAAPAGAPDRVPVRN